MEISENKDKVKIHFDGWDEEWDEWIEIISNRLAQLNSVITNPQSSVTAETARQAAQLSRAAEIAARRIAVPTNPLTSEGRRKGILYSNKYLHGGINIMNDINSESLSMISIPSINNQKNHKTQNENNMIDQRMLIPENAQTIDFNEILNVGTRIDAKDMFDLLSVHYFYFI